MIRAAPSRSRYSAVCDLVCCMLPTTITSREYHFSIMRWPIQRQLLVPMLLVVLVTSVLSSGVSAWVGGRWARRAEQDRLARVVATLTEASFPLQQTVLQKMAGLSGAEFVVWDQQQQVQAATLSLDSADHDRLRAVPETGPLDDLPRNASVNVHGREFLIAKVPLRRATSKPLSLLVLYPEDRWWTATRGAILPPLIAGGVTALIAAALATWWAQRFVKPIARLSSQSEEIAGGVFRTMPLPERDDELRDLTLSINRMVEQLDRYEQQVRINERLRTLGQLGAGLAHQLRNWLAGARMALQLHVRECPLGAACESSDMALRQLGLMESYLQRFLTLGAGRADTPRVSHRHPFSMTQLINDVVSLIQPRANHLGIELQWSPATDEVSIVGDRDELQELLVNLLLNSLDAAAVVNQSTPQRGGCVPHPSDPLLKGCDPIEPPQWVRVELETTTPDRLRLRVLDSGPGPSDAIVPQLFELFTTDKPEGTGLGLAVAKQIAESHSGQLRWTRNPTCFECELPR